MTHCLKSVFIIKKMPEILLNKICSTTKPKRCFHLALPQTMTTSHPMTMRLRDRLMGGTNQGLNWRRMMTQPQPQIVEILNLITSLEKCGVPDGQVKAHIELICGLINMSHHDSNNPVTNLIKDELGSIKVFVKVELEKHDNSIKNELGQLKTEIMVEAQDERILNLDTKFTEFSSRFDASCGILVLLIMVFATIFGNAVSYFISPNTLEKQQNKAAYVPHLLQSAGSSPLQEQEDS